MSYNPTVNDRSGEILGAALNNAGQNLGEGIEKLRERQKQIDVNFKAAQALQKADPEGAAQLGLTSDAFLYGSKYQLSQMYEGAKQNLGMMAQQAEIAKQNAYAGMLGGKNQAALSRGAAALQAQVYKTDMLKVQQGQMTEDQAMMHSAQMAQQFDNQFSGLATAAGDSSEGTPQAAPIAPPSPQQIQQQQGLELANSPLLKNQEWLKLAGGSAKQQMVARNLLRLAHPNNPLANQVFTNTPGTSSLSTGAVPTPASNSEAQPRTPSGRLFKSVQ